MIIRKRSSAPLKEAKLVGELIEIKFDYNPSLVEMVKRLEDRSWKSGAKIWTAPPTIATVKALRENSFSICPNLVKWEESMKLLPGPAHLDIPGLNIDLIPYQEEGVRSIIYKFNDRALLADDMGLGKTAQGIAWLAAHPKARPAVVACPSSLKEMWKGKILSWMTGERVIVLGGKKPDENVLDEPGEGKGTKEPIYILNYDILGNKLIVKETPSGRKKKVEELFTGWVDFLLEKNIQAIIFDEAHYIKSNKSMRGVAGLKMMKKIAMALPMSGTPIENRPIEFWNILSTLCPHQFRNFFKFAKRYCNAKRNGFGWDFNGSSNTEELNQVLRESCMIRRLKKDVLKELPDKVRAVIPLEISRKDRRIYESVQDELEDMAANKKIIALAILAKLRKAAALAKIEEACNWVKDFLESGEKLVIFAHHHEVIDILKERLNKLTKIAEITGRTKGSKQAQEDLFQNDPEYRLIICSKSGKEGHTLTAASNVAIIELFDTPGQIAQAEDRCHRISQKESVTIWYLVAADTVEEDQATLIDRKFKVMSEVLDGQAADSDDLLMELLEIAKRKRRKAA